MKRRTFIEKSSQAALGLGLLSVAACNNNQQSQSTDQTTTEETPMGQAFFNISLAQWSLHKALFAGKMDNLDFAAKVRNEFGLDGMEYVNQFFKDKGKDSAYLAEMKKRADDHGVKSLLIMVDGEGNLGSTDEAERTKAIENHYQWVDAAKYFGCHSIRVNAAGQGTAEEVASAAVDGLGRLSEYAAKAGLNVIVENHGGYSSNGIWLGGVMSQINMPNCGTLPDFGNFCIKRGENYTCEEEYDRYKGVTELMPFAKAVSAKSNDFDADGNEIHTDFKKMLQIVKNAGYKGYIGVEYEGSELEEEVGIQKTIDLMRRVGAELG
ncbi:MAG: sugar phosphate isomerase/epimerase family protein [Saprospiraceae bacterium]